MPRRRNAPAAVALTLAALSILVASCSPQPSLHGPAAAAGAALRAGDDRVLSLIAVDPEGNIRWAPVGIECRPPGAAPERRVGRTLADGDRYPAYVAAYNRALVAQPGYRHATICKAR